MTAAAAAAAEVARTGTMYTHCQWCERSFARTLALAPAPAPALPRALALTLALPLPLF